MSLSYTSLTVIGPEVASKHSTGAFPALPFAYYLSPAGGQSGVVLYPEAIREVPNAGDFAAALVSTSFPNAVVVLAAVGEEDTLRIRFFYGGDPFDEYLTEPGRVTGEDLPPSGGDCRRLASLFRLTDEGSIEGLNAMLRAPRYDDDYGFGEARERHSEIAQLLRLPQCAVGTGYDSISRGLLPNEVEPDSLKHLAPDSGFDEAGLKLTQYVLFQPSDGENEARIAARFLPDVIAWEEDFLEEPLTSLGSVPIIREHVAARFVARADESPAYWLRILNDRYDLLELDLGNSFPEDELESVNVFALAQETPTASLARLCEGTPWAVWSYEARQTVVRSASPGR